jgi:3',5'-cyclic AMP phosphodiesterase CpdA
MAKGLKSLMSVGQLSYLGHISGINQIIRYTLVGLCIAIAFGCSVLNAQEKRTAHFYFAQITDTHFGSRDHLERTRKIVRRLNALPMKIACIVHTGDIMADRIDEPDLVSRALAVMGNLKAPIHYVPGNHDILSIRPQSTAPIYQTAFGDLITAAEYHQVVFLFVYTEPLRKAFSVKGYQPLKQLRQHLEKARANPVIIFHHAPSVKNFYNNKVHRGWQSEIKKQWIELINAYNVKAVIAGHFHRDEFHWLGKVPLYIAPPVAGYWGRQAAYRIYEYRDGKVSYSTQYLD